MRVYAAAALSCVCLVYMETPLLARFRPLSAVLALLTAYALVRYTSWALLAAVPIALSATAMHGRAERRDLALRIKNDAVGRHLVVGYTDAEELRVLLQSTHLAGVFVTARNAKHKSAEELRDEIASFQAIQAAHGRPPLLITTDQEGGSVSRLSGPLPLRPAVDGLTAQDLAGVGVNTNFAPVVDLRLAETSTLRDRRTQIHARAISADPGEVGRVAAEYARASLAAGVLPVAKHFPGLGRVEVDTHLSGAHLDVDTDTLAATDWQPYTQLPPGTAVMVGHVTLDHVDPNAPASLSRAVITEVLRGRLGHRGLIFTDDLCMYPTYFAEGGPVRSFERAVAAGADIVLITYDVAVVYEVLTGASLTR